MIKEALLKELNDLQSEVNLTDFNTLERKLKYFLRFELGDNLENGTKQRVNQATIRASELFESHFTEDSKIYIIIYDFSNKTFNNTSVYIHEILNDNEIKGESYDEKLALRYFDYETEIEWVEGKLSIYSGKRNKISHEKIFNGIANYEMGFEPYIHQLIYFFEKKTQKWFWMYDDRGCLMYSNETSELKDNFTKFDSWIVESQRNQMKEQFR
ncbi:hypothetical protein BBFL7_00433 [Flavobacteria bacterium BBFL7]|nr:hypothetical protein BBFL7_00433 [Flavobacteria bacterium BBFL7]